MRFFERDLDGGRVGPRVAGVERGKVRNHSDVGDHHFQVVGVHLLLDQILDLLDVLLGHFKAGPGRNFQVDGELSRIGSREKGQAEKRIDGQAKNECAAQNRHGEPRPHQRPLNPVLIRIQKAVKLPVELGGEPVPAGMAGRGGGFNLIFLSLVPCDMRHRLKKSRAKQRNHGHGDDVGREQRNHHGQRQRRKQELADPVQESHREEDHHRRQSG